MDERKQQRQDSDKWGCMKVAVGAERAFHGALVLAQAQIYKRWDEGWAEAGMATERRVIHSQ